MNWYVAKLVFRITSSRAARPQFDEQIRLVQSPSFEEAFLKARIMGIQEEDTGLGMDAAIKWEFINVSELHAVSGLCDGTELHSQVYEPEEASSYIDLVHQRAVIMQTQAF